jgi:peptide/nickel transport system substrate-binding protein
MIALRISAFAAALLTTCVAAIPASAARSDNSVRFASAEVLEHIDPYFNNARLGVIVGQHIWDTLVYRDPATNQHKGLLATAWTWIDDKTIEFDLRDGVKFHNGSAFDADDVVYTLNFVSKPENKVVNQQYVGWIDRAERIDRLKVRIVAKAPTPAALEYLAEYIPIHSKAYHEKVGPKGMNERPVGTGPFRVTEHVIGKVIRLERNPDYFAGGVKSIPKIARLDVRLIPDRQTQLAEVLSGAVDFLMNVAVDQAEQLRVVPDLQVHFGETQRIAFLHLDTTERTSAPPLRDVRVRKAILHAIDRPTMVKTLVGEGSRVLHAICFPTQFGCSDKQAPRYDYDPQKAKQLLAEAGYATGFDVDLFAYRERPQTEAMINYLRDVGIRANLRFMQFAAMREQVRAGKAALAHETWGTLVNDVSAMTSVFFKFTPDDVNRDPEVRDLLNRGDTSADSQVRKQAYAKALALIQERAYAVPLFSLPTYYVTAKDLVFAPPADEKPKFWEMSWR